MRKLAKEKRTAILHALVEGCSIRATSRMCSVSKLTVLRLLADVGRLCREFHDIVVRKVAAKRVQVDEIWAFIGCKQKTRELGGCGVGDVWTWTAIDADSKLIVSYLVGVRDGTCGRAFVTDLAGRLANRVQLTADGYKVYREAVKNAFGDDVDFAQLEKYFGVPDARVNAAARYSPAVCIGTRKMPIIGNPDPDEISTSYAERQNLTMRMSIRRFTRLTNAFSKKWANHEHAVALLLALQLRPRSHDAQDHAGACRRDNRPGLDAGRSGSDA